MEGSDVVQARSIVRGKIRVQGSLTIVRSSMFHEQMVPYNDFFLREHCQTRFSSDGRYAYLFYTAVPRICIVDLVLNTQTTFKPKSGVRLIVQDFVVVNPTTIVATSSFALCLLRLSPENKTFEWIEVERPRDSWPTYVLTKLEGSGVRSQPAVFKCQQSHGIRVGRLNVDEGRFVVEYAESRPNSHCVYSLSADARLLYGMSTYVNERDVLRVLDLKKKTWSTHELTGGPKKWKTWEFFWYQNYACIWGLEGEGSKCRYHIYCCEVEGREWKKLPFVSVAPIHFSPIVNAATGQEEDLIVAAYENNRGEVYRMLFKTPDSLLRLAVDALRKFNLDVKGEEGFHAVINMEGTRFFPSVYPNMKPIPRL